mgnify:FL=1
MRYLITGVTGFAGPNLANILIKQEDEVYGLIRSSNGREQDIRDIVPDEVFSKINFIYGDLTEKRDMKRVFNDYKFDGVFHLAAQSHPPTSFIDPKGTMMTNVNGTKNIMGAISEYQRTCALMFCSTSEVYGVVSEKEMPIKENCPIRPINPYGLSKAISDIDVLGRANIKKEPYNLKFFVTRAFSHTGLRRGNKFSISSDAYQLAKIKKGLQKPIINVGTLSSKRVVMDVRDCVRAYAMLMDRAIKGDEKVIGEAFNVGGDELFTMEELLDHMIDISGLTGKLEKKIDPEFVRKIDIPIQIPDSTKLRGLTNWKPEFSIIDKTLPDLLNYWDKKIN